jgi:tetratricopeptide (TPR) repeat protein
VQRRIVCQKLIDYGLDGLCEDTIDEMNSKKAHRIILGIVIMLNTVVEIDAADNLNKNVGFGIQYLLDQKYEKALKELDKAIEKDPNCSNCYFARGFVYQNLKNTINALSDYDNAIRLNSENTDYYLYRGKLRMLQPTGRNWAIEDFTKCLELDPEKSYNYLQFRGAAYRLSGEYRKALKDFTSALELGGKNSILLGNIGRTYMSLGNNKKALEYLHEAEILEPDNDSILMDIAKIYSYQNKKDEAVVYIKKVTKKRKDLTEVGVTGNDHRWDNIRDTEQFKKLLAPANAKKQ